MFQEFLNRSGIDVAGMPLDARIGTRFVVLLGRRFLLAWGTPLILGEMGAMMLQPSRQLVREFGIPGAVLREAYTHNTAHHERAATALRKVRQLCMELGLVDGVVRRLWKARNIWSDT